jgi:cell division protein FtsQ
LSARKHLRKNYYKNSVIKKRAQMIGRVTSLLKIAGGVVFLLCISFGFIFGYDFLTQCNYFQMETLTVTGLQQLSKKRIIKQAQINPKVNILSINLSTTRKRLLANAWVKEAEVSRKLPNKIHISIKEHRPLAILNLGRQFLINHDGQIFKEKFEFDPGNLPIIGGLEFSDINIPGEPRSIPFKAVMNVLRLGQKAQSVLPNRLIKRIHVDKEIGLTLYTPNHDAGRLKTIKLGYNDYPGKYDRLKNVLLYLKKGNNFSDFDSIDLHDSSRIVVSPVRVESAPGNRKEV